MIQAPPFKVTEGDIKIKDIIASKAVDAGINIFQPYNIEFKRMEHDFVNNKVTVIISQ